MRHTRSVVPTNVGSLRWALERREWDVSDVGRSHGLRRRRANSEEGRSKVYKVSASPSEVGLLTRLAAEQGVSVQRLMVEAVVANERGHTSTEQRELVAELFRAVRYLSAISNNVNQIAKTANSTGAIPADAAVTLRRVREVAERLEDCIDGIRIS